MPYYYKDAAPAEEYRKPMLVKHWLTIGAPEHPTTFAVCPRCSDLIEVEYTVFCIHCGQRLKWRCPQMKKITSEQYDELHKAW